MKTEKALQKHYVRKWTATENDPVARAALEKEMEEVEKIMADGDHVCALKRAGIFNPCATERMAPSEGHVLDDPKPGIHCAYLCACEGDYVDSACALERSRVSAGKRSLMQERLSDKLAEMKAAEKAFAPEDEIDRLRSEVTALRQRVRLEKP